MSVIDSRPNKVAKGFTKHYEQRKKQGRELVLNEKHPAYRQKTPMLLKLMVKGTTDSLIGFTYMRKRVIVKHPTEFGYFKEAYVLSSMGKAKLQRLKREKQRQINETKF